MRAVLAMFLFTLPILVICILAWIISGFWVFVLGYVGTWFFVGCILAGFKILGVFK